ncbi:MAG: hypothetical protein ACKV2U_34430 [Bryobacteraceae bacterium]
MLIRREQLKVFEQEAEVNFQRELIQHAFKFAPAHCATAGELGIRQLVRIAVERARKCGFTNRGPIRLYLELMLILGASFETDPQCAWTIECLHPGNKEDQMIRAERLFDGTAGYAAAVSGPGNCHALKALNCLGALRVEDVLFHNPVSEWEWLWRARFLHPERFDYVGEEAVRALVPLCSSNGALLIAMFVFGHGVQTDPQFPWVAAALDLTAPAIKEDATGRLVAGIRQYALSISGSIRGGA